MDYNNPNEHWQHNGGDYRDREEEEKAIMTIVFSFFGYIIAAIIGCIGAYIIQCWFGQ